MNESNSPPATPEEFAAAHTPAPWEVIAADDYFVEAKVPARKVGVVDYNLYAEAICEVSNSPTDFGEANARLIAAAPDLLAAARHILALLDHPERSVTALDADRLRDAIARATEVNR